jgi:hypothetical protein
VESANGNFPRVTIGDGKGQGSNVAITGDDSRVLWLNFGQPERAEDFAKSKMSANSPVVLIKSFLVPVSFYNKIKLLLYGKEI